MTQVLWLYWAQTLSQAQRDGLVSETLEELID
jgi:hypothetical protein